LTDLVTHPFHGIFYIVYFLSATALFAKHWVTMSGQSARDVANQLRNSDMFIKGHRQQSTERVLNKYIPVAATFGGMCIGALSVVADLLGVIGSGTGILLAATILYGYIETYHKARADGQPIF